MERLHPILPKLIFRGSLNIEYQFLCDQETIKSTAPNFSPTKTLAPTTQSYISPNPIQSETVETEAVETNKNTQFPEPVHTVPQSPQIIVYTRKQKFQKGVEEQAHTKQAHETEPNLQVLETEQNTNSTENAPGNPISDPNLVENDTTDLDQPIAVREGERV